MLRLGIGRRLVAAWVIVSLVVTGCSTAQLQKKHTTFDGCFRAEKTNAMAIGAIGGALAGLAIGGSKKGAAPAVVLAAMGAVIGNRMAWQSCMDAFPVKSETAITADRTAALAQGGLQQVQSQAMSKSLVIQSIQASPLEFGRDLHVEVMYRYLSDKPGDRDIKARVHRNLVFQAPDGSQQEVRSFTDDTIQQGVSRARFAIPTPSAADAQELLSTSNWAFKFAIEAEGLRQEQTLPLQVPQLMASGGGAGTPGPTAVQTSAPATRVAAPQAAAAGQAAAALPTVQETVTLRRGTTLYQQPNSAVVAMRLASASPAIVLKRAVQANFQWVQVRLPDGKEGWFKGAAQ